VDWETVAETPWLARLTDQSFLHPGETADIRAAWSESGIRLLDTKARIITAARFNQYCDQGVNKADLLSESTIGLVRRLLERHSSKELTAVVFCDRHGGRRYYGGVLQHAFPDSIVQVIAESSKQSVYRLAMSSSQGNTPTVTIHFTVKGDNFTPVAFSSIHAKYMRERFMESLNRYFRDLHGEGDSLKPTAGYPVDADRFLRQIASTIQREKISTDRLVRSR
jgi:ribonuclease HII